MPLLRGTVAYETSGIALSLEDYLLWPAVLRRSQYLPLGLPIHHKPCQYGCMLPPPSPPPPLLPDHLCLFVLV